MGVSPFKVVHGIDPITPLNLTPHARDQRPSVDMDEQLKEIQQLHE